MAINHQTLHQYLAYLKNEGVSPATLKRKEAALKKFQSWQGKEYGPKYPLPKGAPKPKKIISKKGIFPKAFPPFLRYFSFLIGLVLLASLGWGVYSQFFAQPKETPSMAFPTNPPLLISFQGQLTDDDGTPINATIPAIFRLYNVDEGGTALWEEQKNVSTDQDGIFNTFLGDTATLDPAIFRDNMNLWLAIEIDNDGEMEPRQQIATVGYAFNSRYLQGYEATTAATANTIPVINADGDLILASSSPAIEATSGTFGLKGEAITIQSTGGTGGGDILIQPDADTQGQVIIYSATTADNSFTVQNSNITTGSLIYGEAGTSASGYNLLKLTSGSLLTDKFVVDYAGNTDIAGNLTVDSSGFFGNSVGIGTTSPGATLDVNGNLRIGTLTAGATNTVLIHSGNIVQQRTIDSRVWGSALVDYSGTTANYIPKMLDADTITNSIIYEAANGRIGISTTSPGSKLTVAGGASYFDALPAPTGVTANPTSGGGLVAGTYYYVVNAFDSNGLSSNKSSQVSCTVDGSTTTACQISWVAVPGAVNYRVFGRSSNSQNQYWQTTSTYYTDTGAAGTSGTPPSPISAFFTGNIKAERFADSANDTYYLDPAYATLSLTTAGAAGIGYSAGQMSGATAKLAVDGNVGIGTTTPGQKLEVYGGNILVNGAGLTDPIIQFRDGTAVQWSLGMDDQSLGNGNPFIFSNGDGLGSPIMTLKSGNVGIGTTSPSNKLEVVGGIRTSSVDVSSLNPGSTTSAGQIQGGVNAHLVLDLLNNGASDAIAFRYSAANNTVVDSIGLVMKGDGKVGIGTTIPDSRLHVYSSRSDSPSDMYNIRSIFDISGVPTTVRAFDMRVNNNATSGTITNLQGQYTEMNITNNASVTEVKNYTTWGTKQGTGTVSNWMLFDASNPNKTAGAITNLYGLKIADLTAGTNNWSIYTGTAPSYFGGSVGIGTTGPGDKLHVAGNIRMDSGAANNIRFANNAGNTGGLVWGSTAYASYYSRIYDDSNLYISSDDYIIFANIDTGTGAKSTEWMRIANGNVGIGDTSPNAPLTIRAASTADQALYQSWRYTAGSDVYTLKLKQTVTSGVVRYTFDMINNSTAYNNVLTFDRGNVGIGTTGPGAKLHIYTSAAYPQALIQSTSDHGVLEVKSPKSKVVNLTLSNNNNTNNWAISMRNEYDSPTYRLGFYNAGEKFYIGTDGTIAVFRDVYMRGGGSITNASYINTQQADQHLWIRQYNGTNRFAFRTTDGYGHGKAWVSGWGDLAENIQPKEGVTLEPGDVVKPDSNSRNTVTKSSSAYDSQIVGIISTKPGLLMNQDVEDKDNRGVPVALAGRVPTKVSTINGNIRNGDPLTSSPLPGIAMKATKAGKIIGYAMEDYPYTQSQGDPALDAMDEISYHEEYFVGTYPVGKISVIISPSWYDPDVYLTQTGDIAINDADGNPKNLLADETIETQIANLKSQNYNLKLKTGETVERIANFAETATARLKAGLIETTNLIAENLIAKKINSEEVISPLIETEEIKFSENARLRQGSGGQAKVAIVNSQDEPTAEFNTETKETTLFGDLEVNGNVGIGQEVSAPKASFGDLLAQKINTDEIQANTIHADTAQISADATISGTLYVDRVVARQGGFGELLAENISMDSIKSIVKEEVGILNSTQGGQASQDDGGGSQDDDVLSRHSDESQNLDSGEPSQEEFDLQALLAKVEEWAGTSAKNDLTLECTTGAENQILNQVQDDGSVVSQNDEGGVVQDDGTSHSGLDPESKNLCLVDTNLTVLGGRTSLSDTAIAGQLSVGNLVINNNSLDVLGDTLYIQKLAMGGLDILNGKLTVDIDGNVFIAAHLTVGGGLATNEIRPMEGGDLTFNLANVIPDPIRDQGETDPDFRQDDGGGAVQDDENKTGLDNTGFGKLLVKGINNETVASIDASGSAKFKEIATDLLRINADNEATQSAVLIASAENFENIGILAPGLQTNATAGEAVLPAGEKELVIYNDKLTDQSLVYLTPTADTENKILYVKEKKILNQVQDDGTGAVQDDGTGAVQDDGDVGQDNSKKTGYFVVGLNEGLGWDVRFNWWIIN